MTGWYAPTALGAPFTAHHLTPGPAARGGHRLSLCTGERRRNWQALDLFARPQAFAKCAVCARIATAQHTGDRLDDHGRPVDQFGIPHAPETLDYVPLDHQGRAHAHHSTAARIQFPDWMPLTACGHPPLPAFIAQ